MKRSTFLQQSATLLAGTMLSVEQLPIDRKQHATRFAHITDIHVNDKLVGQQGMARALQHAQKLSKPPAFIINGGDSIMDSLSASKQKTKEQWNIFQSILKNENSLPVYHTIGNHDVWGWFLKENKPTEDPAYGKGWVVSELKMPGRHYSFTRGKWHFIVLDSTQLNPAGGYIGKIDETQMAWLQQELASVPASKYICIVSHIPILSICAGLFFNKTEENGDLKIQRNLMHTDFLVLKDLFLKYPAIKVCLSGHIHMQDEINYMGVKYYCNGAVSGNWWKGDFNGFAPAYAIMDLFDDGTSQRTMVNY